MYTSLSGTEALHDFAEHHLSWMPPGSSSPRINRLGTDEYGERRDEGVGSQRAAPLANDNRLVQVQPEHAFRRRVVAWNGMAAEIVQATSSERIELHFEAQLHLPIKCLVILLSRHARENNTKIYRRPMTSNTVSLADSIAA